MAGIKRANTSGITKTGTAIPDVPDAPTIGTATNVGTSRAYNNGSATVAYTAATTGGAVTTFTATSSPGGFTATGSSPITVTGLQSNTAYTFTVTGTNATATGPASSASGSITATTVPQAPTIGTATDSGSGRAYNNGSASVAFTAGATGGSSITGYTVTSSPGSLTGTGASSPITVTGQSSATAYTYTVTATNANGTSSSSSSSASVTATTVPQAPTIGTATIASSTSASITFTAGATGGSSITSYTVTSSPGSLTGTGSSSPITVSGLTTGTAYTFTVTATNVNGTSAASSASNSVTPAFNSIIIGTYHSGNIVDVGNSGIVGDSSGNIYASQGYSYLSAEPIFRKFNSSGTAVWSRTKSNSAGWNTKGLGVDSSGNVYGVGFLSAASAFWIKYDSSGTLQSRYAYTGGDGIYAQYGRSDSSGNSYICSNYYPTGVATATGHLMKLDSSGNVSWTATIDRTTWDDRFNSNAVDSSGNVYVGAQYDAAIASAAVLKYNSSGALQWQRTLTGAAGAGATYVSVNSSNGDVYAAFNLSSIVRIVKYNSSGTIQWQRQLGSTGVFAYGTVTDSSGNVYVFGKDQAGTPQFAFVAKWNSSGTLQWQRKIYHSSNDNLYPMGTSFALSSDETQLLLSVNGLQSQNTYVAFRIPTDGSKTGTYTTNSAANQTITYTASSYSETSSSLTDAAGTATASTFSPTRSTPAWTDVVGTNSGALTDVVVTL